VNEAAENTEDLIWWRNKLGAEDQAALPATWVVDAFDEDRKGGALDVELAVLIPGGFDVPFVAAPAVVGACAWRGET